MMRPPSKILAGLLGLALSGLLAGDLRAASSDPASGHAMTARLLAAEDAVPPGRETLSAGLEVVLEEGWKTYWRSPGEVGLPPELDWSGSENVAAVEIAYPVPSRFEAFEIQNFGYGEEVVYPLAIRLAEPGAPARLALTANLLVCADICVPETVTLALDLPEGGGIDRDASAILADWVARVPGDGTEAGLTLEAAHLDAAALTLTARSGTPFGAVDIFPEQGAYAAFDPPEILLSEDRRFLWARLPVLSEGEGPVRVTLAEEGGRAATMQAALDATAPLPPTPGTRFWWMLAVAALGGLILNAMPCVLPILSIKLASALQARDRGPARVRAGFLAAAAGVMAFFAALALAVIAARGAGLAVGWGVQFQSPVFLAVMIGLMTLFAANMLGFFDVSLSSSAMTGMARTEARGGWGGDFATGAFAAVMATPCSAPFIGTAVTYALTHGPGTILAVFLAMGLGLALPYLLVAARPALIERLPRPGRWMRVVQTALAAMLLIAALWLLTVLAASAGLPMALAVAGLAAAMLAGLALRRRAWAVGGAGLAAVLAAALLVPQGAAQASIDAGWERFSEARKAEEIAAGRVVFVDVTADWCLTCAANKRLVLDRGAVALALAEIVALQADWTRPDADIAAFLERKDRFGIPFNAVFGPGAPDGIVLPELLTETAVLDALAEARG